MDNFFLPLAALAMFAQTIRAYYETLISTGFKPEEALQITIAFQTTELQLTMTQPKAEE